MESIRLKDWQVPLADHQTDVLKRGNVFLCAATTGAGKTYLACQTIKDLGLPTLVVVPKIAISQWRHVAEGMGVKDLVLDVVNPEQLSKKTGCYWYRHEDGWTPDSRDPKLLVWDETHRSCSGPDSKSTLALARWCNKAHPDHKVLAMSATPFDSPIKMRALGYLMGFYRFVDNNFYAWCRSHGCANEIIGRYPRVRQIFRFTTNTKRAQEIMAGIRMDMGERFLSIGPDEIPGFPDEVKEVVMVDLAKKDHDALVKAYEEMPERIKGMSEDDMVRTLRLRQQAEFCKAEAIAEMACDLVEDGYSVFIALNFTDARLRIEDYLRSRKIGYASIYGGQKETERQAGIDAFQANKTYVMVGMMPACSVALSLHDERHERKRVSLISPGYSASEMSQSLGRIRRVGGTTAVQKIIIAAGSVEERVGRTIQRKLDCLSALTDSDLLRR